MYGYAYAENEAKEGTYQAKAVLIIVRAFSSVVTESCWLMVAEHLIHLHEGIINCSTVRSLIMASV